MLITSSNYLYLKQYNLQIPLCAQIVILMSGTVYEGAAVNVALGKFLATSLVILS